MRYILSLGFIVILFFSISCHKEVLPVSPYRMTLKKDGTSETLSPYFTTIRPHATMPGITEFQVVAKTKDDKVHFAITILVNGSFTPGVYQSDTSHPYPFYPLLIVDYFKDQGQPDERDFTIDPAPARAQSYFTTTITSIDSTEIKGTFSGNYLYDRSHDESITITDGSFVAKRH